MSKRQSNPSNNRALVAIQAITGAPKKAPRFAPGTLAIAVADSKNTKLGKAATTYAAQASCPTSCVFFDGGGCYAEQGPTGMFITAPLNAAVKASTVPVTPESIAAFEAKKIDKLKITPGRPLRLHTLGDCKTNRAAALLAASAARYVARGGGPAWTYTHAWRIVRRESWGDIHVFASCETPADVAAAHARGYATAMVVDEFKSRRLYEDKGVSVLPCPAQTTPKRNCANCGLCMNSELRRAKGQTIGFAIHGTPLTVRKAHLALTQPNNPNRKLSSRVLIPPFIASFTAQNGRPPTTKEIATALQISPSSVSQMRRSIAAAAAAAAKGQA